MSQTMSGWRSWAAGAADGRQPTLSVAEVAKQQAAVAETHLGVVFFVGDRAYKLKKPVELGFVDFRSLHARLEACKREVGLNRRLAPDVYLGVADVVGPDGRPCEHLVVMRRMPADRRLSSLIAAGAPVELHLRRLAKLLAEFHAQAETSPAVEQAASRDAQAARWEANASETAPFLGAVLNCEVADRVIKLAGRYLAGRQALFDRRIVEGRARDGHGDLLADDIFCLDDGPRVLDCLEFDDRLRYGDVLADVAFLAMDLERIGRPDLARLFLEEYRLVSADRWPASLAHHYVAYRAQVRAKVACLRWAQGHEPSAGQATQLLQLAHDHLAAGRVRLVLVGGLPGTGKSTLAHGLARALGAVVVRSDEVRKELAGLAPDTPAPAPLGEGLYDDTHTDATYARLVTHAERALGLGESVVLDASWRHVRWRAAAARMGERMVADLVELRCVAPPAVTAERIASRLATRTDASDATPAVARALAVEDKPWPTASDLDTTGAVEDTLAAALSLVNP